MTKNTGGREGFASRRLQWSQGFVGLVEIARGLGGNRPATVDVFSKIPADTAFLNRGKY